MQSFVYVFFVARGVGAMEIVAMDMKLRGMYMARQLSFQGVSFKINEIPLSNDFIKMYNDAVKLVSYTKVMKSQKTFFAFQHFEYHVSVEHDENIHNPNLVEIYGRLNT